MSVSSATGCWTFYSWGGVANYVYQNASSASASSFQLLAGPTLNFSMGAGGEIESAIFLSALAGITTGSANFNGVLGSANTQFTIEARIGKRFRLGQNVSYAPSVGVSKETDFSPSFVLEALAVSVFF